MYLPDPSLCNDDDVLMLPQISNRAWNALPDAAEVHKQFGIPPYSICIIFGAVAFVYVFSVIRSVMSVYKATKGEAVSKYPEADAWARSKFDWLWMGWATLWISRWGTADNSALTKISSADIPMSDPNDECELCFRKFEKLWKEELARVGSANASLLKVVTRFVTYKKIFAIAFWNAFYEGFMFLGPPMAIKWVTKYLNWLYTQRGLGMAITQEQLVCPSLIMILTFCGLPILMAISNSMCTMLNGRISIRIDGALSLAVYDKAQRLPVVQDDDDDLALVQKKKNTSGSTDADEKSPEDIEFEQTPVDDHEKLWANGGVNKRFNLVQVVTNDINTNLMMIPNSLARMVVMIPVLIGTLCMLVTDIGLAFFFSLAMAILNLGLMTSVGLLMRNSLGMFYSTSGKRLQFLQEVLVGIRFVKGCGAEGIVQDRLAKARAIELRSLDVFYTIQCFMFILTLQLPKLYILASLGGYAMIKHGDVEPTIIMSVIPLLMSVQGAIAVVFSLIPTLVMALPSCRRLETFFKIKEAPRSAALPLEVGVHHTEKKDPPYIAMTQPGDATTLRIQGHFSWQSFTPPLLTDVDIRVPQGALVAVIGAVGSGKSTLLHAILGELFPHGDTRIEMPRRMAYSAQNPHLFEGSLKDNVLIGTPMDPARYKEAIYSACLVPDLEMLPGGDEVPVGGRGITLSGGQKARVSMARAAYNDSELVLIDDPFAAVDAHTGRFLNENLLHGPLLRNRSRVIVCQPDSERMPRFDWVIIMKDGRITVQGPAKDVMKSPDYQKLMCSAVQGEVLDDAPPDKSQSTKILEVQEAYELREEECEGRASMATLAYFGRMGGWLGIGTCITFYLVKNVLDMKTQVQLSMWMSHGSLYDSGLTQIKPNPWTYMLNYVFWMAGSTVAWFVCWVGGQSWTLGISEGCHRAMCKALLRAPIDRFYDKTPTGRIMNRMANDMMNVDMQVFVGCCSTIGMIWSMSVPIYYVHLTMPLWFTLITVPMYYLVMLLISLYWKTMVPLRYLMQVSKSGVSSEIADVENTPSSVRAYNMEEYRLSIFALAVRKMIAADFLGRIVCIRWLCNRLFVLGGFFVAGLALLCIWLPGALDVGSASLVINTMFSIIVMIEGNLSTGSMAQYQIIAMNRIYEYTALPEEREEILPTDTAFQSMSVSMQRVDLGLLERTDMNGTVHVSRMQRGAMEALLSQHKDKQILVASKGKMLADLAPGCAGLRGLHKWHRIVCVNGEQGNLNTLVNELIDGESEEIHMLVESGWLADGVKIEIKDLRVGYADVPQDVLHGISLIVPRFCKAGVVGPTGCGKSTLLLCLLRMLEPRDGVILLEGVDTTSIGLRTLRNAIGLVPQDPVLLQGTLRFNIDPFEFYSDARILEALELVHMKDYVLGLDGGLDFTISGEGANLSFGQRQLLSLARNIVRKPMLLLLDEATSAIDPHTQELLQATIQAAFPDSTMVVIAHRLETILDFDMGIVMDRGRVAELGPLRELAGIKDGKLAKMLAAKGLSLPPPPAEAGKKL
uniref:ATP-dependent transporter ycf16 n=1 Tax=Alexandrium catenella TaxID=2925 RepID=A0A7S1RCI9_ALECA